MSRESESLRSFSELFRIVFQNLKLEVSEKLPQGSQSKNSTYNYNKILELKSNEKLRDCLNGTIL